MKNSKFITQCKVCGDFRGLLVHQRDPSDITRGFCRCEVEGWEVCARHEGRVRRRFRTIRITSEVGDYRYFSVYAMMAPCRVDTCFKSTSKFIVGVRQANESMQRKSSSI